MLPPPPRSCSMKPIAKEKGPKMRRDLVAMLLAITALTAYADSPVVVEVFESQGCSSCPPSERVIQQLHQKYGGVILPLLFHVDYLDNLGWKDTFSNPASTELQNGYASVTHQDTNYT